MSTVIRQINQRMSLRKPQQLALDALHQIVEKLPLSVDADLQECLAKARELFPNLEDFEREFPNVCLALATGVGKTRLMGAIISYLALTKGIRNFFVLAPNTTITEKLVREFSQPNDPKYVFRGISEFASQPPRIVTADNYDRGFGVRNAWAKQLDLLKGDEVHINIFNVAMIHSQQRSDSTPRIKRPRETIRDCLSYFDYLAQLEDLVIVMDEAHHYRASAASKAINELKPILGVELTATPEVAGGAKNFRNIIYSYPLSAALNDGLVKQPWVAGREHFKASNFDTDALEKIKLEDGVRIHENTKIRLQNYTLEHNKKSVKPFILVVAQDIAHANEIKKILKADDFFDGNYRNKIQVVHSGEKAAEEEQLVNDLLEIESFDNPIEIVIHVNKLKEGWDVKNLYTIVPLRASASSILTQQTLGRGLRLPFGQRTGIVEIDRLTVVSHDRFKEIVDEAKKPNSLIKAGMLVGHDIPFEGMQSIEVCSKAAEAIQTLPEAERSIGQRFFDHLAESGSSKSEEFISQLIEETPGETQKAAVRPICEKVHALQEKLSISFPRIVVQPKEVTPGRYARFTLHLQNIHPQSFSQPLLFQNLEDGSRDKMTADPVVKLSESPQEYLARALLNFDDISETEEHVSIVLDVADQMVAHLKNYLKTEEELHSVIIHERDNLVDLIHRQMASHYIPPKLSWDETVDHNFTLVKSSHHIVPIGQNPIPYDQQIAQKSMIKDFLFTGFKRSCFHLVKFDVQPEQTFAILLEQDDIVLKWVKPSRTAFQIFYHKDSAYIPDFVVETIDQKFLVEIKRRSDLEDLDVKKKTEAAVHWCALATKHAKENGGKPWSYLLIPHDAVDITMTLEGLARRFTCHQNIST